jgi:hypothetical protein
MAAKQGLAIYQGADFRRVLEFKDELSALMDLTGYTFRGQARTSYTSSVIAFSFEFTVRDQGIDLGIVDLLVSAVSTEGIVLDKPASYIYDIEMILPVGDVRRILEGKISLYPEVTR